MAVHAADVAADGKEQREGKQEAPGHEGGGGGP